MNKKVADNLFRVNDIRAVYGTELTDENAYEIGKAFATYIKSDKIIIGRDTRLSSVSLSKSFSQGVLECGSNVIDLGLVDTPCLYFATAFLDLPGIMITASHNPAKLNGIKFCKSQAITIGDINGLLEIKKIALSARFNKAKNRGYILHKHIFPAYVKHILSFANRKSLKPLRTVIDAGNGMGALIAPEVYRNLPLKITPLYFKLDGRFPNHVPNPAKYENLRDLQKEVLKTKADFGIAFDGDADRVTFIDEQGQIVDNSITAAIIFDNYFKNSNKRVVYSSICSKIVSETVERGGGKAFRDKVGHMFIKSRMRKEDAVFGCEEQGHFFYKKNFYADSGIITSLIMYQILSKNKKSLSALAKPYKKYEKAEEISLKVNNRNKIIKVLEKIYKPLKPKSISHMDGLIVDFDDYWFSVKPANTEPLLRVNIEAKNIKILEEKKKELLSFIKKANKI